MRAKDKAEKYFPERFNKFYLGKKFRKTRQCKIFCYAYKFTAKKFSKSNCMSQLFKHDGGLAGIQGKP